MAEISGEPAAGTVGDGDLILVSQALASSYASKSLDFSVLQRSVLGVSDAPKLTDWNGFLGYGQSLSVGGVGTPPISTTQPYSNLTFTAGVLATKAGNSFGGLNPGTGGSKALIEENPQPAGDGGLNRGETICSGAANMAVQFATIQDGIAPADFVIFASAPGHGAYVIANLVKGAAWYQNLLDHASQAALLAANAAKSYGVHAMAWIQGETDAQNGLAQATYSAAQIQLADDASDDIVAMTRQESPVHMLTYQTSAYVVSSGGKIALAQLDAVRQGKNIHFVVPTYVFPNVVGGVHLTNIGYLWMGRYFGRAYKQLVIDGQKPDCLWPLSATAKGATLQIKFRVPKAPLVLDAVGLAATLNSGFVVQDDSGAISLSAIAVVGDDVVQMTLGRSLSTNPAVRYALDNLGTGLIIASGASGNLRDSTADASVIQGVTYPMWHVSPAFSLPIVPLDPNS